MTSKAGKASQSRTATVSRSGDAVRMAAPGAARATNVLQRGQGVPGNQALQRSLLAVGGAPRLQRKCAACEQESQRQLNLQPKLAVNQPGDALEREADRVADAVMRMPDPAVAHQATMAAQIHGPSMLQRACACGGTCKDCQDKAGELQRASTAAATGRDIAPSIVHEVLRSPGQPLDAATRSFMEPRFGADFSRVRIHTDARAAESARAVNALAYTVGQDVVFAAGQYAPGQAEGCRMLSHELSHVLQQSETGGPGLVQRACGPREVGTTPPANCSLVSKEPKGRRFLFDVNCDSFAAGQQAELESFVASVPEEAKIDILGMASAEGDPRFNTALSCLRANAAARVISDKGLGSRIRSVEATGPVPGTEHDDTFRAVAISIAEPDVRNVKVTAKSFIATIGSSRGSATCTLPIFVPSVGIVTAQDRLDSLAVATDLNFSEDPTTDAKDKAYRLFSERTFSIACFNGKLTSVTATPLDTDAGKEGPIQAPPLIRSDVTAKMVTPDKFAFSWKAKGRPHPAVEPSFQIVCPRDSVFIWHRVEGEVDCAGLRLTGSTPIVGSHFPSHRVFIDGTAAKPTVRQGPFRNLWISDPSDKTQVN